jgi:DNA-binding NarL/FixJ family response regulator
MLDHQEASKSETSSDALALSEVWKTLEVCAAGLSTVEVADRLGVDPDMVRLRVERAKAMLGAGSKLEAVVRALRVGLIAPPPPARP